MMTIEEVEDIDHGYSNKCLELLAVMKVCDSMEIISSPNFACLMMIRMEVDDLRNSYSSESRFGSIGSN